MEKRGTSHVAKALEGSRSGLARGFRVGAWRVSPEFCTVTDGARTEQLEPKVMADDFLSLACRRTRPCRAHLSVPFQESQHGCARNRRLLGTTYLVDGSVRSDGQQLRITMQLIDARTA